MAISSRRYYYRAAVNLLEEGRDNLAFDVLNKRAAITPQPFGACPVQKTLKEAISPEFTEEVATEVFVYEGLDDLIGANREELEDLDIEDKDIEKILKFLESL